jgi:bifunctional non-homologous end joining protein LigD
MKETITLYFKQGSSDKIYQASIEPKDGKFIVNFAYGRRGATLQTGTKTSAPVDYATAKGIYERLVREKTAKGYTPGEDGTPYQHTANEAKASSLLPQLPNPIDEADVGRLLNNSAFVMQEKFDGRRMLVRRHGAAIEGINRRGLFCGLPSTVVNDMSGMTVDAIIDGETVGGVFIAFDLVSLAGADLRGKPYRERCAHLINLLASFRHRHIRVVETAHTAEEKRGLLATLRARNAEGVVFKRLEAPYVAGRPASGGDQFKHKFHATASFIVGKANGKRSVSLLLYDGGDLVPAGNVTIPANHDIPRAREVVEVRYLYAFKESGSVFQPVYLGPRDDIAAGDCTVGQLKHKADIEEEAAA